MSIAFHVMAEAVVGKWRIGMGFVDSLLTPLAQSRSKEDLC